ncbi:ATP-binding protein [Dyadobacter sp. NIV53]|uniref:ATP-binding protein n=1 Tax=Dyadobacter sp. NIV53 TaxID=2861765 RepID=UPI001C881166|nr:ATP-binding protein [Dyadobacter sp. NIV53]
MIERSIEKEIIEALSYLPSVAILGPRQVGKTTLVKQIMTKINRPSIYLDLEYFADRDKLREPDLYFQEHEDKLVILDEIQRVPDLFPLLRSMIDKKRTPGRFILLGSASPELIKASSETLAGRILYFELQPLHYREISPNHITYQQHWIRGGFPDALLAPTERMSELWMRGFLQTYIERDLVNLGMTASPEMMRNLLRMLTNVHGGLLNYSDLANSLDITMPTLKNHINFLERAFLVRRLEPYFVNISKRLIKSPKIFIRDSGLFHFLIGITDLEGLSGNISLRNSWEGYVIQQIIASLEHNVESYFYRTKDQAEMDLVLVKNGEVKVAIEIKYSNSPGFNRGNTVSVEDLGAKINLIVTPQAEDYWIKSNVRVCNINSVWKYLNDQGVIRID